MNILRAVRFLSTGFVDMLHEIRVGSLGDRSADVIAGLSREVVYLDDVSPIQMCVI
jgi:hypothetical protein